MSDTIAAVSTPFGTGGIAVIRISGSNAIKITEKIFISKKKLSEAPSHSFIYGKVVFEGVTLDRCLCSVFRAPNTFTGEDMTEINCHGGIKLTSMVLEAVLKSGARLAEKGEFSKRAFINGKMMLSDAEAVIDLINAKTESAAVLSAAQMEGKITAKIDKIRDSISAIGAKILAVIDFPDEGIDELERAEFKALLNDRKNDIKRLIDSFSVGRIYREGLSVLLIGKTNVGKSSLLNRLADEKRAIVTDIAGTTRDVIEEFIDIKGIPVKLLDTAGIRNTEDTVEKIGVERSKELIQTADIVVCVLDLSRPLDDDDNEIFKLLDGKKVIFVRNKSDLCAVDKMDFPCIDISCKSGEGIDLLCEAICDNSEGFSGGDAVISNVRHKNCLERAVVHVNDAIAGFEAGLPEDMVLIDLENACMELGSITGKEVTEQTVNHIFADFCVGK